MTSRERDPRIAHPNARVIAVVKHIQFIVCIRRSCHHEGRHSEVVRNFTLVTVAFVDTEVDVNHFTNTNTLSSAFVDTRGPYGHLLGIEVLGSKESVVARTD